ncbi:hypothetical protein MKZ38_006022 [Zalerion maritima]|uniref:FHA domain-containing protein n=1 Tax=Zalerion maritima TaxID=339359 RepID=A0AAD5RJN0_9PEZI|nr:hypothetical protein MKZ38_006022 [Zalerion maritima]
MSSMPEDKKEGIQPSLSAIVSLEVISPPSTFRISKRTIILDSERPVMNLGRSSKVPAKGCTPEVGNGWFDSPVMSRDHAILSIDIPKKRVLLTDTGSLHGTHVDHQKLDKGDPKPLSDSDKIRFGVQISRSSETFPPCYIASRIQWKEDSSQPQQYEARPCIYRVPDESDNDNDSCSGESESMEEYSHTQPLPPTLRMTPTMIMVAKPCSDSITKVDGPSKAVTAIDLTGDTEHESIDLTGDAEHESEVFSENEMQIETPESPIDNRDAKDIPSPSHHDSGERSSFAANIGPPMSPIRQPIIDLDQRPDVLDVTDTEANLLPLESRSSGPVNTAEGLAADAVQRIWGSAEYSDESDGMYTSEDIREEDLSVMGDEDDDMFEGESDGDEIRDDDEHSINMSSVNSIMEEHDWDASTNSESCSGNEEEDSEEDDVPLSPPMPEGPFSIPKIFIDQARIMGTRCEAPGPNNGSLDRRFPSPSDAVMPKPIRYHTHTEKNLLNLNLGERAGKAAYFAAREINGRRFLAGEDGPSNTGNSHREVNLPSIADLEQNRFGPPDFPPLMVNEFPRPASQDRSGTLGSQESLAPPADGVRTFSSLVFPSNDLATVSIMGDSMSPQDSNVTARRTYVGINELVDGFSQNEACKEASPEPPEMKEPSPMNRRAPSFAQMMTSRPDEEDSSDDVEMSQDTQEDEPVVPESNAMSLQDESPVTEQKRVSHVAGIGSKRRIDEISQESGEDRDWAAQTDVSLKSLPCTSVLSLDSPAQLPTSPALHTPEKDVSLNATTGPTPPATPDSNERPAKRRRQVAETLGIAAIGALSASIGIFATLVATAPSF